jgi:tripartite-type tricarboxylate transporter receptor subunit TctC
MAVSGTDVSPAAVIAAVLVLAASAPSAAQPDYPSRPIRIIAPVAASTVADIIPRIIAEKLSARWGLPIVVENRPGGANNIGTEAVARAEPDGYTLLVAPPTPLVINQNIYPKLAFDPAAFVPVTILADQAFVLVTHPKVPATTLREFVAYAKANPGKLSYGSSGLGTGPHLAMELLNAMAGTRLVHVTYRGLAPALTDLLAGHIDAMFNNLGTSVSQINAGSLRGIGLASEKRSPKMPELPAIAEVFPGFAAETWFAVVAPPKTPTEIAARLSIAINEILRLPDVVQRLDELHATPVGGSPAETAAFLKRETEQWRKVIAAAGIKAE